MPLVFNYTEADNRLGSTCKDVAPYYGHSVYVPSSGSFALISSLIKTLTKANILTDLKLPVEGLELEVPVYYTVPVEPL